MAGMIDLTFERRDINLARLHEELSATLGSKLVGVSRDGNGVRVHLLNSATSDERRAVEDIVTQHDASRITAAQQEEIARRLTLKALREKPWSQWTTEEKDYILQQLAENLLWKLLEV